MDVIVRKLINLGEIQEDERFSILSLPFQRRDVAPNELLVSEGKKPSHSIIVLSGLVFRFKSGPEARQIVSLHIPGDMPDIQSLLLKRMDHGLSVAASSSQIAMISHAAILALFEKHPRLERLFWHDTLIDASLYREALTSMGTRPAMQRMAHYFCEHYTRMKNRGLAENGSCEMQMTQSLLSEALGLSLVSANRSVKFLRNNKLADHKTGS